MTSVMGFGPVGYKLALMGGLDELASRKTTNGEETN
jgi:hypothetical protein